MRRSVNPYEEIPLVYLRAIVVGLFCLFSLSTAPVAAQTLDDAAVLAAIRAGESGKVGPLISDCLATSGFGENMAAAVAGGIQPTGSFDVIASTAPGRIAYMAADGKRLYKPLKVDDVPAALRSSTTLFVVAIPRKPVSSQNVFEVASPIERIVLKSKVVESAVVQPENVELEPVEWANLVGGKIQANRAIATFPVNLVKELPPGDIDIVLITQAGERRCKIGKNDRAKIVK